MLGARRSWYAAAPNPPPAEIKGIACETDQVVLEDETREEAAEGFEAEGLVATAGVVGPGGGEVVAIVIGEPRSQDTIEGMIGLRSSRSLPKSHSHCWNVESVIWMLNKTPKMFLLTLLTPASRLLAVHHEGPHAAAAAPAPSSVMRHCSDQSSQQKLHSA